MRNLEDTEKRARKIALLAPMGKYYISSCGIPLTSSFRAIRSLGGWNAIVRKRSFFRPPWCSLDEDRPTKFSWESVIHDDDQGHVNNSMLRATTENVEIADSLRLKKRWKPPSGNFGEEEATEENVWIFYRAFPNIEDGQVTSFIGCLTDISHLKWAENVQVRRLEEEKRERKRKEDFIDITSHEMRNPLSAITQCADSISHSLSEAEDVAGNPSALFQILRSNAEAAESILLCAAHQKRILDDVLTLSKLDSSLLAITPTPFRPHVIITETVQMFNAEFSSSDINVRILSSFKPEDTVLGDPSRILQIFINRTFRPEF